LNQLPLAERSPIGRFPTATLRASADIAALALSADPAAAFAADPALAGAFSIVTCPWQYPAKETARAILQNDNHPPAKG